MEHENEHAKSEHAKEHEGEKRKRMIALVVLAVLLIVSLVQAVEISGIKKSIESGSASVAVNAGSSKGPSGGHSAIKQKYDPSSLPAMVGGC